ncbi:MAG: class I SAM-dependent methyltransferase [Polyangiaceae bacterium]|nr:class I SAM-dependent methyltransferase [Polyangiaceae bacterium]
MSEPMRPWSPCKLCDAMDFFRPGFVEHMARVGELPWFHAKQWEYFQLLETRRVYAPNARVLVGLGCGCELTIPPLAEGAEEVIATDLYGRKGAWDVAQRRPDEVYPQLKNLRVHSMDMRKIDLPPGSADFVWSLCAVEHVGGIDEVADTLRQAGRLLSDSGVLFVSTEYNLGPIPYRDRSTLFLDRPMIERVVRESGLYVVAPIELRLTEHPFNIPLWSGARKKYEFVPHITYRAQKHPLDGTFGTVISFVLSREDRKLPLFDESPDLPRVVERLADLGREGNRRLAPPWKWF